jgi:hypothetical protein
MSEPTSAPPHTLTHAWSVVVRGQKVGAFWATRGGGYTLRTGPSVVRPRVHHFSEAEGLEGLMAYVEKRFGARPELLPPEDP